MKAIYIRMSLGTLIVLGIYSCKKQESADFTVYDGTTDSSYVISDSISSAASLQVKDKQFIKTADVNMEVKDVYEATISIEKSVHNLGGFVTHSNLKSDVVSQNTYNTSGENAMLIKKYQTENSMQVRIPTERLGELLTLINNHKLFLNSRIINAEDITANIKYAELETQRNKKTDENISQMKTSKEKVSMDDTNMKEGNQQQLNKMNISDQIKYSTVDIYIREPKLRIAEIAVTNTKNIDNKYKFNFLYDAKNAFIEGFYLIQKIAIGLINIWPILLIAGAALYFWKKRKISKPAKQSIPEQ
ncbi:DUF4349 domain-containing protein [Chryseobacterium sp.]|uniref:DUF4349 domain-containing protein n=1 Tax=Chryseobacterium sp. TaxID=1871047 RepID=UPI0025B7C5E8|nr:DUF4349 domain-containing protein [Chryseobacterium sp.]